MKIHRNIVELDPVDRGILEGLQDNCKQSLGALGEKVGLSAPSIVDRIHKLEEAGVICGYAALLDARRVGKDVTAFIGVGTDRPAAIRSVAREVCLMDEALDCHHVTGSHTLMLKVKTRNTETLEGLIDRIRGLDGVTRTETMVVLSTHAERSRISFSEETDGEDDFEAHQEGSGHSAD
jgi:Lrp/AsnC family leucine-responsive transcriptional regulator